MTLANKNFRAHLGLTEADREQKEQELRAYRREMSALELLPLTISPAGDLRRDMPAVELVRSLHEVASVDRLQHR